MVKPLFKWPGGKTDEIQQILTYIPDNIEYYIEPFVGAGALFFHLQPTKAVVNDVHKELVDLYRTIQDGKSECIYDFMETHPNNEDTYYEVRSMIPSNELENASKFYYLRKTCYRGMSRYNKRGEFNICFGRYKNITYDTLLDKSYEDLLRRTKIFNCDFEEIFENYNSADNFMFLDPPYDCDYTDYGYCKFGQEEHRRLAECFKSTNIRCLMVIGKTPFIEELYDGYIAGEYDKRYRIKIHSNRVNSSAIHLVIKNY
tara:strand:- start:55 stop:828 length:774 start_codon:yes stop_codon:yes gene_type:complete